MSFLFSDPKGRFESIAQMICDAGGSITGRTKLQKTAYLLHITGYDDNFQFRYKHYGPFSEQLAEDATVAAAFGKIAEDHKRNKLGDMYFQYHAQGESSSDAERVKLVKTAAQSDPVALELAATAAYLFLEGYKDPWKETAERKPDKVVGDRLNQARELYNKLRAIESPTPLPKLP